MKTDLQHDELDNWVAPPLDPETIEALKAMGARFPRGGTLPPFEPVKKRPAWLAFLLRIAKRV